MYTILLGIVFIMFLYVITHFLDNMEENLESSIYGFPVRSGFGNISKKFESGGREMNQKFAQGAADITNKFNRNVANDITGGFDVVKGQVGNLMMEEINRLAEIKRVAEAAARAAEAAARAAEDEYNRRKNEVKNFFDSDRRIKKNIIPLVSSLAILRKMKPVRYQWKDCLKEVYGFIAQDLQECLPSAVTKQKGVIHNIFQEARCEGPILTFTDFDTSELSYDAKKTLFPLHIDGDTVHILEILDETRVRVDKVLAKTVFVYGQEVDDFHTIDNHQIFTVTTSAVQELDQKVQRLEEENKALKQQVTELFKIVQNL